MIMWPRFSATPEPEYEPAQYLGNTTETAGNTNDEAPGLLGWAEHWFNTDCHTDAYRACACLTAGATGDADALNSMGQLISAVDRRGNTAAHLAARYGHVNCINVVARLAPKLLTATNNRGPTHCCCCVVHT